ncbi:formylmethanofuran dehydrogenase subunit C [Planctomicrobium sp. SH668]|uniref:formylmethanofuran dehydrogenase subunit C n=1 Tax=Planctomicrobium sp. SH668 TaxID=3448126 RepID=UPI003F5C3758
MPLTFRLRGLDHASVNAAPLQLETLRQMEPESIAELQLWCGNRKTQCGELFEISGSLDDGHLLFEGDCTRVSHIGANLKSGLVHVNGSAGSHLGANLNGGSIQVRGNVGNWVGAEMKKGRIEVFGDVGDHAGGAYPGSKKGMRGGEILVDGNAGHFVGERQRRGLIAISGNVGEAAGLGMIAGTILINGSTGPKLAAGMKRGSIILLGQRSLPADAITFRYATTTSPTFLQLYFRHLLSLNFPISPEVMNSEFKIYRGDFLESGLGEIITRNSIEMGEDNFSRRPPLQTLS